MAGHRLQGKQVLVLGGLGLIGSNLAIRCKEEGAEVAVYDSLAAWGGGNRANLEGFQDAIEIIVGDIREADQVGHALARQDVIFNCAAQTSHPHSMRDPFLDIDVNCRGALTVLEAFCKVCPDARMVYVGTSTQCGAMVRNPMDETHPEFPTDIYSADKTAAEKYHLVYHQAYGLNTTVLRLPNVFGPRARIDSPDFGAINFFVGLALQDKAITVYGDGRQKRNILYVDDAVEGLIQVALDNASGGEVYFAAGGREIAMVDFAELIVQVMGKGRIEHVEWPEGQASMDIGNVAFSNKKIKGRIGWEPRVDHVAGLTATKAFYEPRLDAYLKRSAKTERPFLEYQGVRRTIRQ